jgi:mRNA interferase RelE/StbE
MVVKFRREAIKCLQKALPEDAARIQAQLNQLLVAVEKQGIIPFTDLDIKKMKGEWKDFIGFELARFELSVVICK